MADAEWKVISIELPPEVQAVLDTVADVIDAVAAFLDLVAQALDLVAAVAQAALDTYSAIVNALIDAIQAFLNDLRYAGIYMLIDYPKDLTLSDLNPVSDANLAGTVFDPNLPPDPTAADLTAIANKRKNWARQKKAMQSYRSAINRITTAFDDGADHLRPPFSDSAATYGVVIMAYSEELAIYVKLVRALSNLFALNDFKQALMPGISGLSDMLGERWDDLADMADSLGDIDWCDPNLIPPNDRRNMGTEPNFVGRYVLQDLFPPLGQLLQTLSNMVEVLRPNGALTEFIQDLIDAIKAKVERLNETVALLQELADQLREGFSGTKLTAVAISSSTGNKGFKDGLIKSTGHPGFEQAFVCSVLLYAGGPSVDALKLLFSGEGEPISDTFNANLEREQRNKTKPVLVP